MLIREFILPDRVPECHASTVISLPTGGFLAAWFVGSRESAPDTAIAISRRSAGGWELPRIAAKVAYEAHWNPVLYRLPDNRIALYFKVGASPACWKTFVMYSTDEGDHWSAPAELVPGDSSGGRGPVKNQPLLLQNGMLLAPGSTEQGAWLPRVDISFSSGREWERCITIPLPRAKKEPQRTPEPPPGLIQPALWESSPGHVHMLLRSDNGRIFRSDSDDSGLSWCEAYPTELPNNNSGIDLKKLPDGRLALVCNVSSRNWGTRRQIVLRLSDDNGDNWAAPLLLESTPEEKISERHNSEFSYPTVIADSDGKLAITYTWHRENIRFICGTIQEISESITTERNLP